MKKKAAYSFLVLSLFVYLRFGAESFVKHVTLPEPPVSDKFLVSDSSAAELSLNSIAPDVKRIRRPVHSKEDLFEFSSVILSSSSLPLTHFVLLLERPLRYNQTDFSHALRAPPVRIS